MLVLNRRVGERIMIGNGILVEVVSIRGNRVKLGFVAPSEIRIMRTEALEKATQPERQY